MAARPNATPSAERQPRDLLVIAAAILAGVQIAVLWLPTLPLGIPGEWQWDRIQYGGPEAATLFLRLFVVLPVVAIYISLCWVSENRFAHATRSKRGVWLISLAIAGFGVLWIVQDSPTYPYDRLGRGPLVLYFPSTSGYFTEAREADDFGAYLAGYESLMSRGDVLHLGTHPPGLIALHRGLLALYERSPMLVEWTLALRPDSAGMTEDLLQSLPLTSGSKLSRAELAELWGATLLVQVAAIATLFPLYSCTARSAGRTAGWRAACMWPLVPALAVFLPKSDALYPLIGMSFLACWHGWEPAGTGRAALAGVLLWFGMTLSLALLPAALLALLLSLQMVTAADRVDRPRIATRLIRNVAILVAVFASLTVLCRLWLDLDLLSVWNWNLHNHAGFYSDYSRTYWKWLLVNPVELAFAVGVPVAVCSVAACGRRPLSSSIAAPVGFVVLALWLSGKNSGEAARLWLFLMPWLIWLSAEVLAESRRRWRTMLVLQAVVCFLTAVRIGGFGFAEMISDSG